MAVTTSSSSQDLPEYLKPYVTDMLARGQALSNSPSQTYGGQRVADMSGLQQQAAGAASGLDAGALFKQGNNLTAQGANYDPNTATFDKAAADQYMNPYTQSVTDITKREAVRNADMMGTADASRAAQAGAFGGSRHGIVDAERERNLQTNLSDIDSRGLSAAYTNAQSQFNADQNRQQQDRQYGSQAALKGGQDLTQSGGQAFGMQNLSGALQQGNQQQNLDVGYQNFLSQQQHPYDQLNFMKNLSGGYGGGTTTSSYAAPDAPGRSGVQQFGDVISGAAGLASAGKDLGFWAKGGVVPPAEVRKSGLGHGRVAQLYGSL